MQTTPAPPVEQVLDGLWSIPVPIPGSPLPYVLAYAFAVPGGVVLVDPGWNAPEALAALTEGLGVAGARLEDVRGVLVTHIHPDHYGLAARIREVSGAWVGLHPADAALVTDRYQDVDDLLERTSRWVGQTGAPAADLAELRDASMALRRFVVAGQPDVLVADGDRPDVPGWRLRALHTPGHTPGHLCFVEERTGAVLTGDHVLPTISPNISRHPRPAPTRWATTWPRWSGCGPTATPWSSPATSGASAAWPGGSTSCWPTTRPGWTRPRRWSPPGRRPSGRSRPGCAGAVPGRRSPASCAGPPWARPPPT
jgi:glyoxylase-like metal-dependent hydrolase (beta-lactamase superfamily II)